jgi:hypothetical protein
MQIEERTIVARTGKRSREISKNWPVVGLAVMALAPSGITVEGEPLARVEVYFLLR